MKINQFNIYFSTPLESFTAPEVDLFSFDDAPAPAPANNTFDAFQTAPAPPPAAANDDFGDFQEIAPSAPVHFDAFSNNNNSTSNPVQTGGFDAFGGSTNTMNNTMSQNQGMMGGNTMNAMNNAFGNMNMQSQTMPAAATTTAAPTATNNDDDFGDFTDADPSAAKSTVTSSDPLSSLISLDGLTKNTKKEKKASDSSGVGSQQTNTQMGMSNNPMGFQGNGQLMTG